MLYRVKKLRRRGIGEFGSAYARKAPMKIIGHHQQAIGDRQQLRTVFLKDQQLVQRIELQELQAGRGKNLGPRHPPEGAFHDSSRPRVAIMERLAEQFVGL